VLSVSIRTGVFGWPTPGVSPDGCSGWQAAPTMTDMRPSATGIYSSGRHAARLLFHVHGKPEQVNRHAEGVVKIQPGTLYVATPIGNIDD
jgi:hypothetical protein